MAELGSLIGRLPPGLDGYVLGEQMDQNNQQHQFQTLSALAQMQHQQMQNQEMQRQMQQRTGYENAMRSLPPDATEEQMLKAARPFQDPNQIGQQITASRDRQAQREQRTQEIIQRGEQEIAKIREAAAERRITQQEADAREARMKEHLVRLTASLRSENDKPYFSPFDSSNGAMVFDHRTGKMTPAIGPDGNPIVKAANSPMLQGELAGAKETGKARAERAMNMAGLGDAITEAEQLLKGTSGKALPTGSGVGTAIDISGGLIGVNPEGAKEAQRLKAIGGALTSKMPRMQGPQSDKDTRLYAEMAGLVGDSTVPRERRLAALEEVRRLWGKYDTQNLSEPNPSQKPDRESVLQDARNAIKNGAPRDAVIKRLQSMGLSPQGI